MVKILLFLFIVFFWTNSLIAQKSNSENLVLITLDGLRWQEIFGGVDSALINNKNFTRDSAEVVKNFWNDEATKRREKLFPFLWKIVAQQGQLYGNRAYGNYVNVKNKYNFSYPGYNEILTGYPDTAVNSNNKILNKNSNVLEFINNQKEYRNKVAAFTTWDVFPFILNAPFSSVYVNSDIDTLKFDSPAFKVINDMQFLTAKPLGVRPDVLTYMAAREYVNEFRPKVLYIAFDETDDFAHEGLYDQYLKSAHAEDAMISNLWTMMQSIPQYKNNTTFIITCDHGRGDQIKSQWRSHGQNILGSDQIWMAFIGKGIDARGEIKQAGQVYQSQLAQTMAKLLGFSFSAPHPIGKSISSIISEN